MRRPQRALCCSCFFFKKRENSKQRILRLPPGNKSIAAKRQGGRKIFHETKVECRFRKNGEKVYFHTKLCIKCIMYEKLTYYIHINSQVILNGRYWSYQLFRITTIHNNKIYE